MCVCVFRMSHQERETSSVVFLKRLQLGGAGKSICFFFCHGFKTITVTPPASNTEDYNGSSVVCDFQAQLDICAVFLRVIQFRTQLSCFMLVCVYTEGGTLTFLRATYCRAAIQVDGYENNFLTNLWLRKHYLLLGRHGSDYKLSRYYPIINTNID